MAFYNKFVGTTEWPLQAQRVTQVYGTIRMLTSFAMSLTGTFLILYILDAIGFKEASIVITVMLTVQLVTDYPSGSLGDRIGQRWVLGIAIFSMSIAFYLLAFATTVTDFIIVAAIIGFANAQASGALQSWYDNNYKKLSIDDDPEKKNYGYSMNRLAAADSFVMGITFIIGGMLATYLGRTNVFIIQASIGLILTIIIVKYMKDIETDTSTNTLEEQNKPGYFETLKGGVAFVFKTKTTLLLVMGIAVFQFVWVIWGNLLLFPIYFGYSGTDEIAGFLRSIIFFVGVAITIAVSGVTKKLNKKKMNLFFAIQTFGLFGGVALLLYFLPMTNQFSLIGYITIIVLFTLTISLSGTLANVLAQRIILDFFPSEYRNSLYSFIPTATGVLALFFLPMTGSLIESYGLIAGIGVCTIFGVLGLLMMEIPMRLIFRESDVVVQKKDVPNVAVAD